MPNEIFMLDDFLRKGGWPGTGQPIVPPTILVPSKVQETKSESRDNPQNIED